MNYRGQLGNPSRANKISHPAGQGDYFKRLRAL
jgi:hypothetical protein